MNIEISVTNIPIRPIKLARELVKYFLISYSLGIKIINYYTRPSRGAGHNQFLALVRFRVSQDTSTDWIISD